MIYHSKSLEETALIAEKIAKKITKGSVIAFFGEMGSGKTTLCFYLARNFEVLEDIFSPTYAICAEHQCKDFTLYHFDMYKVFGIDDLELSGYFDKIADKNGVTIIEWSENVEEFLPKDIIKIYAKVENDTYIYEVENLA